MSSSEPLHNTLIDQCLEVIIKSVTRPQNQLLLREQLLTPVAKYIANQLFPFMIIGMVSVTLIILLLIWLVIKKR